MFCQILTEKSFDSDKDCVSCYQDVTTFSGGRCNGGTNKYLMGVQCCIHSYVDMPPDGVIIYLSA